MALTSDSSTKPICDAGLETLLESPLESKATILVNPQVVTWETSTDLCTFYRADFSPSSQPGILTMSFGQGPHVGVHDLSIPYYIFYTILYNSRVRGDYVRLIFV